MTLSGELLIYCTLDYIRRLYHCDLIREMDNILGGLVGLSIVIVIFVVFTSWPVHYYVPGTCYAY